MEEGIYLTNILVFSRKLILAPQAKSNPELITGLVFGGHGIVCLSLISKLRN